MDKRHRNLVAVLVAVVMAVALFSAFSVNWLHKTPSVILPTLTPTPSASTPASTAGDYQRVEVTVDTVQRVVATLERPESYARTLTVETTGEDGTVGKTTAQVVVDGGWTRVTATLPDGRVRHTIVGRRSATFGTTTSAPGRSTPPRSAVPTCPSVCPPMRMCWRWSRAISWTPATPPAVSCPAFM